MSLIDNIKSYLGLLLILFLIGYMIYQNMLQNRSTVFLDNHCGFENLKIMKDSELWETVLIGETVKKQLVKPNSYKISIQTEKEILQKELQIELLPETYNVINLSGQCTYRFDFALYSNHKYAKGDSVKSDFIKDYFVSTNTSYIFEKPPSKVGSNQNTFKREIKYLRRVE